MNTMVRKASAKGGSSHGGHHNNKHCHPDTLSLSKGALAAVCGIIFFVFAAPASAFTPNDPLLSEQWYLSTVGAFQAWDITRGDPSVIVAVIDSGVDIDHPDLSANIWTNSKEMLGDGLDNDGNGFIDDIHGWDFLTNSADPRPKIATSEPVAFAHHHGTAVAGIIAAVGNNGKGISGIAPHVTIMPLRALDSQGKGSSSTVIKAIDYAIANGASIINLSFVSTLQQPAGSTGNNASFFRSLERARRAGVLVVAAAGNEATAEKTEVVDLDVNPQVPVCEDLANPFQAVIGVAATDREDHRAVYSSFGRRCIDLSAPGERFFVLTASRQAIAGVTEESYGGYYKGTSLASPVVVGAAALLLSLDRTLRPEDVQTILEETAAPIERGTIYDGRVGKGRVDIAKAVERVSMRRSSTALAQSVGSTSAPPSVDSQALPQTVSVPVVESPPAMIEKKKRENILLAFNEKTGVRLVRTGVEIGETFEQIVRLPGMITSITELTNREIAVAYTARLRPTEIILFTGDGVPIRSWRPFGNGYAHSLSLAAGDVDGDGAQEIVVAAGIGVAPVVAVFSREGTRKAEFLAYAKTFRGGVDLAVGNVLGSTRDEIVTTPLTRAPAHIRVFDGQGNPKVQFFATPVTDRAGASVVLIDRGNDDKKDIAVSLLKNKRGQLLLFGLDGKRQREILAFDTIDRAFTAHRDFGSTFITVAARVHPSIVAVLTNIGKRVRVLSLPKNIESVALGTIHL